MEECYAKIFVDDDSRRADVMTKVAEAMGGHIEVRTLVGDGFEVDFLDGEPATADHEIAEEDAFLYYPLVLELVAVDDAMAVPDFVAIASKLMHALHADGAAVVAACDFEEALPGGGRLPA